MKLSRLLIIAAFLIVLAPQALFATDVDINIDSHTYYSQWEDEAGNVARDIGTLYEYLSFDISVDNMTFVFAGWGKSELMGIRIGYDNIDRYDGDFSAAYIDYLHESSNLHFRLGRQVVSGHGSYESLSGAFAEGTKDIIGNLYLTLSGYYGIPEELEEMSSSGDSMSGGRATLFIPGKWELGYSYLKETDDDNDVREEEHLSLWFMPFSKLELYGENVKNLITKKNARSFAEAVFYLSSKITIEGSYETIDYEHYFQNSELTIFNFFNQNDELETTAGALSFSLSENLSLKADIKDYSYKIAKDNAMSYGGALNYATGGIMSELSYHKTDSDDIVRGYYDEYRLYIMKKAEDGLLWSLDGILDQYENKINGEDSSVTVIASTGYRFNENFSVSVDLDYSSTPLYEEDYKAFARIEYFFGKHMHFEDKPDAEETKGEELKEEPENDPPH